MSGSKKGWRDSNWYVSITGFWREYRKHRIGLVGLALIIIFVGMAIFAPILVTHDPTPQAKVAPTYLAPSWLSVFDPNGVVTGDLLTDPNLEEAPLIVTNGTSTEFSGVHVPTSESNNHSYVNLTWSHTAGNMLDYNVDPENILPDYNDFVYFEQNFTWPYNNNPSDVNMSISFGTTLTGDFAPGVQLSNNLMFRVYVWLIDSSNQWTKVYESREATYVEAIQEKRISMNYLSIKDVFGGMVLVNGTQEDPSNDVRVLVGLSPYRYFNDTVTYGDPWSFYNGNVTFTFTSLKMIAYGNYFGLMGSTNWGADAYSQLIYGSRISLIIGILATGLSTALGVIVGMVAGYFGGKVDEVLMRIVDFLLVIPGLPLMMVLAAFLGASIGNIIIVIAILGWTGTSRLIRSQVLAEKNKAYVESARAIGASDTYIMFRHILPNVTPILFANITLGVVGAILSEAGLSFLGLTDPEDPSWGRMLADARTGGAFSTGAWWVVLFPGLMITLLSLAFTFVGHTLDQVLNPRLRER
ncbi:MAG: ABC transporter permease [Candidatus Thorarchaeota archaeon]|nr:ABC transporter permease [Candidatus Thorarchaeota archaeon]